MYNDLITIGKIHIYSYGICITIGVIAAMILLYHRLNKYKQCGEKAIDIMIAALIPGFIGAKINYILVYYNEIKNNDTKNGLEQFNIFGKGFVIYGGILFGMIGVFTYCRLKKLNIGEYMDTVIASVALAQGFGRIGCFMAGCCFGIACRGPFSVVFRNSEYAPNGYELVPTQLIFSAADFINCIILCIAKKHNKVAGTTMILYMITYGVGRFFLEFLRGDSERGTIFGMSTAQFTSICMTVVGCILYGIVMNRHNKNKEVKQ